MYVYNINIFWQFSLQLRNICVSLLWQPLAISCTDQPVHEKLRVFQLLVAQKVRNLLATLILKCTVIAQVTCLQTIVVKL